MVAPDGKALRRAHDRANGKAAIHLVSAWATANRPVVGQVKGEAKANEITALPAARRLLALDGCIVATDAMGGQTAIAQALLGRGADRVLALTGTQPAPGQAVAAVCAAAQTTGFHGPAHGQHTTVEQGHGRIETRRCGTISEPEYIAYPTDQGRWAGLRRIGMAEAERTIGGTTSRETRSFISSPAGEARQVGQAVRAHRGIAEQRHRVLDSALREAERRGRQGEAAQNCAVPRQVALNLLRQEGTAQIGVKAKRLKAGWDEQYLLKGLTT